MLTKEQSRYSVLMSIYIKTTREELKKSVDSMLAQTIPPEEFILVCDGQIKDEVKKLIEEYIEKNPGVFTVLRNRENRGLAYALNCGIEVARNEIIARMDSDDISLCDRYEKQLMAFEQDAQLALVGTRTLDFVDDIEDAVKNDKIYPTSYEAIKKMIRRNDPFAHPTVMYKKPEVIRCGLYDPNLRRRQDYDLFSKMIGMGCKAINLPEALLYYKMDKNNMNRLKDKETCKARVLVQKRIYKRGDCSFFDYVYIVAAMTVSRILPANLYKIVYRLVKGY